MRILAFNVSHDASICSINNGKVEFFCKEERLSRIKRDYMPFKSLELYKSLNFGKIDHALYLTPTNVRPETESVLDAYLKKVFNVNLENYSRLLHHKCHASIAYFNSGFKESLVFVIDRNGSIYFINGQGYARESESVYLFDDKNLFQEIYKSYWLFSESSKLLVNSTLHGVYPNSDIHVNNSLGIVKVYEAATTLIGQPPLESGKTMGLASYGENKSYSSLFIGESPITEYFSHLDDRDEMTCFYGEEHLKTKNITENNYQHYANRAKHVQIETQNAVLRLIEKYVNKTGIKNVCIVGGYALNVVANNFYIKNLPHVNFYFEPVADDTGISVGAAMLKYYEETKNIPEALQNNFYHYYEKEPQVEGKQSNINEICDLLISQKSVAIFEGNPEAGPRALGHRSILFDARNINAKQIVNEIKMREWYRPFAGIILESEFEKYFKTLGIKTSSYMTINFEAKDKTKKIVPGIIHVDGTCRIQTVSEGFLFDLLTKFYKKTGCPMLLNTSFNLAGEPLVHTKKDALLTLNESSLDAVYFVEDEKIVLRGV